MSSKEELKRRGVDERNLHLVMPEGYTISEHLQTLTRSEQAEFAELRLSGDYIIRPSDETETAPREVSEARQSTIEFALIARNGQYQHIFEDRKQAREFVDLLDRLAGEGSDAEAKRVWAKEMYGRFLYEKDPNVQQQKLKETMEEMRRLAAEIAPLDPGRNAMVYLYTNRLDEFKKIVATPEERALKAVREAAIEHMKDRMPVTFRDMKEDLGDRFDERGGIEALKMLRRDEPERWGSVKGRTNHERGTRALEYLEKYDQDTYMKVVQYNSNMMENDALEFLKRDEPEAYDLCHRYTPERFQSEINRESATNNIDPTLLRSVPEPQVIGSNFFSLEAVRSLNMSFSEAREAYEKGFIKDKISQLDPASYGTLISAFELGEYEPGKAALAFIHQQAIHEVADNKPELHQKMIERYGDDAGRRALKLLAREDSDRFGIFRGKIEVEREKIALGYCQRYYLEEFNRINQAALEAVLGQILDRSEAQQMAGYSYRIESYNDETGVERNLNDIELDSLIITGRDDSEAISGEFETSYYDMVEQYSSINIRDSYRMGSDYIVMGEVYDVPPLPEELLDQHPELKKAFSEFEERISERIWNGDSIGQVYASFNGYVEDLRFKEMANEVLRQIHEREQLYPVINEHDKEYYDLISQREIISIFTDRLGELSSEIRRDESDCMSRATSLELTQKAIDELKAGRFNEARNSFREAILSRDGNTSAKSIEMMQMAIILESGNSIGNQIKDLIGEERYQNLYKTTVESYKDGTDPAIKAVLDMLDPENMENGKVLNLPGRELAEKMLNIRSELISYYRDEANLLNDKAAFIESYRGNLLKINEQVDQRISEMDKPERSIDGRQPAIIIEDGNRRHVNINNERVWQVYSQLLVDYNLVSAGVTNDLQSKTSERLKEGIPSVPAIYSTKSNRHLNEVESSYNPATDKYESRDAIDQLQLHFSKRLMILRTEHPELSRISGDPQFRYLANVMRSGYDPETKREARDVLDNLKTINRIPVREGKEITIRLSRNDLKMLEAILVQQQLYRIMDATRHITDPKERSLVKAQIIRDEREKQREEADRLHKIELKLKADLVSRAENFGHKGIDLFIALTKNKVLRNGTTSPLYEPFKQMPETKQAEIYRMAKEQKEKILMKDIDQERENISKSSATMRAYMEIYKQVSEKGGITRSKAISESWTLLQGKLMNLKTYPESDREIVVKALNQIKQEHEKLEKTQVLRNLKWESAQKEAVKSSFNKDVNRGQNRDLNKFDVRQIYSLVTDHTRRELDTVDRSVASKRLQIAKGFNELDQAAGLAERPFDRIKAEATREQLIVEKIRNARVELERKNYQVIADPNRTNNEVGRGVLYKDKAVESRDQSTKVGRNKRSAFNR